MSGGCFGCQDSVLDVRRVSWMSGGYLSCQVGDLGVSSLFQANVR